MAAAAKAFMVELEERLYADESGKLKTSMLEELRALQARLEHQRRQLKFSRALPRTTGGIACREWRDRCTEQAARPTGVEA